MERIKQALEKVKAQQAGEAGRKRSHHQTIGTLRQPVVAKTHDELGDIRYEYTRVFELQKDHLEKNRIVSFSKDNPNGISFDLLRTHVLQKMEENGWRTLAITSPTPEAGKSVVAINLAMSISQQTNRTALLVDFDLRRPKIGAYLGLPMEKSLNEVLAGVADLRDALINPGLPRLVVLPTRNPVRNSSETLSSGMVADLTRDLRERYKARVVIFDMPPLLVADDALAMLPQVDCVLLVVANGMSTRKEVEDSLHLLPAEKLLGTVLNKADIEMADYYY